MLGWDNTYDDRWRGILPQRDTRVALTAPVAGVMLRRPVRLCMHSLRALQHSAFALDVYLWDAWHPAGPEPAPCRMDVYRALAEHPVPRPDPTQRISRTRSAKRTTLSPSASDSQTATTFSRPEHTRTSFAERHPIRFAEQLTTLASGT